MTITREQILEAVRGGGGTLTKRDIALSLGLSGEARRELRFVLKDMLDDGTLVRNERKQFHLAGSLPNVMVLQVERIDEHGDLIAVPLKWDHEGKPPSIVLQSHKETKKSRQYSNAALGVGDKALCRITRHEEGYTAKLMKKLAAAPAQQLGVVVKGGRGFRIRPVKKGARFDFLPQRGSQLNDQDLVMFELSSARHKGERIARIKEVIGSASGPRAASLISLYEHNIPTGFGSAELAEAEALRVPKIDKHREDMRKVPLITIDPDDAKDFDDAIFAQSDTNENNPGGFIVWVAIADVSAFVTPGSALDKGAQMRGNSTYLPDRVVPMLPEELSADLCSLRPHEDRACLAARMVFNQKGEQKSYKFIRGLMRSHARLTYGQAQKAFLGKPGKEAQPVTDILADIFAAYQSIKEARGARGPLEINMPERAIKLDGAGNVIKIEQRERFDAHKLVEEFMIQANVAAAKALDAKNAPLIYRVHETPSGEKIQGLADFLPALGLKWSLGERPTPKRFNRLIDQAKAKDLEETVSMSVLRSQMQAYYGPKNGGHFGLNLTHYAHFTSPIRRYADLVVHRALVRAFGLGGGGSSDEELTRLKEISEHISTTERRSMAAERDAKDRYIAAYLQDKVGTEFEARISGVTRAGLFLTLDETGADGFVPVSRLGVERFLCDEKSKSLVGTDTGATYKFGMRVKAELIEATPVSGGLLFDILSPPQKGAIPKHSGNFKPYARRKHKGKRRRK